MTMIHESRMTVLDVVYFPSGHPGVLCTFAMLNTYIVCKRNPAEFAEYVKFYTFIN